MEWPASSQIKRAADTNQGTAARTSPEFQYGTENPAAAMDAAISPEGDVDMLDSPQGGEGADRVRGAIVFQPHRNAL